MMKQNITSSLYFDDYIVDSISFKNNPAYKEESTCINFSVDSEVNIEEDKQSMVVKLTVDIFKDAVENNYPFEMSATVEGSFRIQGTGVDVSTYKRNAIAILYPYVRALVSNYTAVANVNPLILPAINVNKLIEAQSAKNNEI